MNVEFTDRYGGHLPSALRVCGGSCEGLGWYPVQEPETAYEEQAVRASIAANGLASDGWYFIRCDQCRGSGCVSWARSLVRVPWWIWRGLTFLRFAMQAGINPPEWSTWKCFKVALWCCYGADLQRLRTR